MQNGAIRYRDLVPQLRDGANGYPDVLLRRSSLRYLRAHPWQIGLALLGVTLGVAIVVGMNVAIASSRTAFRISTETVAGRATHQIVGGPGGVPTAVYTRLRVELGVREAAPVVEEDVGLADDASRVFRLLGVDPLAEAPIRPFLGGTGGIADDVPALLTERGVWLSGTAAASLGVAAGDTLRVTVSGRTAALPVLGTLEPADRFSARALESLLVADIATAQALLGVASLSRIDVRVPAGPAGEALLARIGDALPPGTRLVPAGARGDALAQMTRAFSINLTALSLLALLFGIFFIYNAITFSVVQRRTLLGTLRALGVTRGGVVRIVLIEAALLGAIGGAAGVALGLLLGRGLVGLVARTINDLYFAVAVQPLAWPAGTMALGFLLGFGGTIAAALPAAWEAAASPPRDALTRSTLERGVRRRLPALTAGGAAIGALGGLLLVPPDSLPLSFAGLFALMVGCALLVPAATLTLMRAVRPLAAAAFGALGRLAAAGVGAALSRTAPALAALMVAIAATVALGAMIGSFRGSVVQWLETTLQADVYVSAPGLVASRPEGALSDALVARIRAAPGVDDVATYRSIELLTADGPLRLGVLAPAGARSRATYRLAAGDPARAWPAFEAGDALVSEPFAYRHRLAVGDSVTIPTDRGARALRVAGVFYDYGPDQGVVLLHRATYDALFADRTVGSLAVYARAGVDPDGLVETLRGVVAGAEQRLFIRANRTLREASLEVFDRTFAITAVLRVLAVIVAFVGVLAALTALQLERAREFAVLRATGVTPGQLWGLVTAQTGLMGLAAGALAVPVGALLAAVMIHVVNRRSFGWSLELSFPAGLALQGVALAVVAALLAGLLPAWRLARTPPARALREE